LTPAPLNRLNRKNISNCSVGTTILGKPPLCNWSAVLQIRSFGTSKHTSAIREGQNGRSWSAAEQLQILLGIVLPFDR